MFLIDEETPKSVTSSHTKVLLGSHTFGCFLRVQGSINMKFFTKIKNYTLTRFCFFFEDWKLVPGPFMILTKWQYNTTSQFLVDDVYNF